MLNEQEETDKFKKASRRIYKMFMRAIRVVIMSNPAMMLSMYASFLMISWFGAHLIVGGSLTTGELTSMFSYTMTILMSLMMFMMIFVMLSISMASVERINEVLNTESTIVSPENGLTEVTDGSISFDHVDFSYTDENGDKTHVLKDISLDIKSGEVIGILVEQVLGNQVWFSSFLVFMMWRQVKLRLLATMLRIMIWIACVSKLHGASNQRPFLRNH